MNTSTTLQQQAPSQKSITDNCMVVAFGKGLPVCGTWLKGEALLSAGQRRHCIRKNRRTWSYRKRKFWRGASHRKVTSIPGIGPRLLIPANIGCNAHATSVMSPRLENLHFYANYSYWPPTGVMWFMAQIHQSYKPFNYRYKFKIFDK